MSTRIVECVPNFSEGRNQEIIDAISNAGRGIDGARVLGVEPDGDYNRTVLTIAGGTRCSIPSSIRSDQSVTRTHRHANPRG